MMWFSMEAIAVALRHNVIHKHVKLNSVIGGKQSAERFLAL